VSGHIFDTGTIRNFLLTETESVLAQILGEKLYFSSIINCELTKGANGFLDAYAQEIKEGNTSRLKQYQAWQECNKRLQKVGFQILSVSQAKQHETMLRFFACLITQEDMDQGEAECFALSAFKGLAFYTDDNQARRILQSYNQNLSGLSCPPYGTDRPPHHPIVYHSTTWLLLEGIRKATLKVAEAEDIFFAMRSVWGRHPQKTLTDLKANPTLYW
jgi:predicted nucleic acid-binding protein